MKINLGCGAEYKKNYLNIDAYDKTVADKIMDATDLKIDDNQAEEILALQLIEHLGIIGGIHCLSECFRVLKPKGVLIIETPDLIESFKQFLNGDRETRKNLLPWIYGVNMQGMLHKICFPDDLLKEILVDIGFENIKIECYQKVEYRPILKATCTKPDKYETYQIITHLRKKLLEEKIIDTEDQNPSIEKDKLIMFFCKKLLEYEKTKDEKILKEIRKEGSKVNPGITKMFFQILLDNNITTDKKYS